MIGAKFNRESRDLLIGAKFNRESRLIETCSVLLPSAAPPFQIAIVSNAGVVATISCEIQDISIVLSSNNLIATNTIQIQDISIVLSSNNFIATTPSLKSAKKNVLKYKHFLDKQN